jgi:hypothetical protein
VNRSLNFAASLDGAQLTRHIGHIMAGLKVRDRAARDPITGNPLLAQSRDLVFPLELHLCKETKDTTQEFGEFFDYFLNKAEYQEHKLNSHVESDMKVQWVGLLGGGAAKILKHPCFHCGICSDDLHICNATRCTRWCSQHSDLPNPP